MKPNPFGQGGGHAVGPEPDFWLSWDWAHLGVVSVRLLIAGALAALVAFRPWRRFMGINPPRTETTHAQVMIAVAGAMMVVVIGDSLERAFGLVGLGAFIRFRAGIKDPRDAAVMFVMIGIGMACGLTLIPLACGMAVLATILLIYFDFVGRTRARRVKVSIRAEDLKWVVPHLRATFPGGRILETWSTNGTMPKEKTELVIEVDLAADADAATIMAMLEARGIPGLHSVTVEED
jgi:uncharacterized membrane protein YhiD involved in acid resistance